MKKETKAILFCIVAAIILLLIAVSASSCKVVQPTVITRDSVRVEYRLDSVYLWKFDSVYVSEKQRHDTIFVTERKWSIRYKDKEVIVHDTINSVQREQIVVTEKYVPKFYKGSTIALWCLIAAFVIYVVLRIVKAVYLRK